MAADNKSYSHKETYKTILKLGYTTKQAAKALGLTYERLVYILREDLKTVEEWKEELPPKPKKERLAETRERKLFFIMKDKKLPINLIAESLEITMVSFYKKLVDKKFYSKCIKIARAFPNKTELETKKKAEKLQGVFNGRRPKERKFQGGNPIHDWDFFGDNSKE